MANTKPYIWESETSVGTPQNLSPVIGISYIFLFMYTKSVNQILKQDQTLKLS